jgi:hypothetical protein
LWSPRPLQRSTQFFDRPSKQDVSLLCGLGLDCPKTVRPWVRDISIRIIPQPPTLNPSMLPPPQLLPAGLKPPPSGWWKHLYGPHCANHSGGVLGSTPSHRQQSCFRLPQFVVHHCRHHAHALPLHGTLTHTRCTKPFAQSTSTMASSAHSHLLIITFMLTF